GFAEQFGKNDRLALSRFKAAVEVWSLRPSLVHGTYGGPGPAETSTWPLDLSPDGRWLASTVPDKGLVLWDLVNGATPGWLEMPGLRLLCFHPERPELYLTTPSETIVRRLVPESAGAAAATPRLLEAPALPSPTNFSPHWIALSRDGQKVALGS